MAGGTNQVGTTESLKERFEPMVLERLDLAGVAVLPRDELYIQVGEVVRELFAEERGQPGPLAVDVAKLLVDEMLDRRNKRSGGARMSPPESGKRS